MTNVIYILLGMDFCFSFFRTGNSKSLVTQKLDVEKLCSYYTCVAIFVVARSRQSLHTRWLVLLHDLMCSFFFLLWRVRAMTGLIPFFKQNGGERLLDSPFFVVVVVIELFFVYSICSFV